MNKHRMVTLQLLGWSVIIAISLILSVDFNAKIIDRFGLVVFASHVFTLVLIYLLNYTLIIPKYLFRDNKSYFYIFNFILIALLLFISYVLNTKGLLDNFKPIDLPERPRTNFMFLTRDLINYILMIGLVTALRLAEKLQKSEEALKEAESARVKAELANLRSQINPHFLLNTLNNIYALTAIDTEKAQKTIKELSNLLRYILYDNLNDNVSLTGEIEFLKTYIELMSIRLPRKVRLKTEYKISEVSSTVIAPLIFISLIENAFKHSVSSSGEGYINIYFEDKTENNEVILSIKNSNNAKADEDKSGHGIGLEQVRRRLELLYHERYSWKVTETKEEYSSILILRTH